MSIWYILTPTGEEGPYDEEVLCRHPAFSLMALVRPSRESAWRRVRDIPELAALAPKEEDDGPPDYRHCDGVGEQMTLTMVPGPLPLFFLWLLFFLLTLAYAGYKLLLK